MLQIRSYRKSDAKTLWQIFHDCVHKINIKDYSCEQIQAWAPTHFDAKTWQAKMDRLNPFIAEKHGKIIGYADLQPDGLIDHFFCHYQHQREGVGRKLMAHIITLARKNGLIRLYSEVSITARPFYEKLGFQVVQEQKVFIRGQNLNNFIMERFC